MTQYSILEPITPLYAAPDRESEVVTQAIYSWKVSVLKEHSYFKFIQMSDGYQGWVEAHALAPVSERNPSTVLKVISRAAHIYHEPDLTKRKPMITLPFESELELLSETDSEERWLEVRLLDDRVGWIQRGDILKTPFKPIQDLVTFSKSFLGLPYTWGGTSSYGYDCSGFVQMLFRQAFIFLPRDARDQMNCEHMTSIEKEELRAEDLIYYGPYQGKITHVAMYIGNQQIIHACTLPRPMIQISAFDDECMRNSHPYRLYRRAK